MSHVAQQRADFLRAVVSKLGGPAVVRSVYVRNRSDGIEHWFLDGYDRAIGYVVEIVGDDDVLTLHAAVYVEPRCAYRDDPEPLRRKWPTEYFN